MIISRFCPSPTGSGLHLGSLRTMLTSHIIARQNNGQFIFRIEDTDQIRSLKSTEEKILQSLEWLGVDYNGPVERQSDNSERYDIVISKLLEHGLVYYCGCSVADLKNMKAHQIRTKGRIGYNSRCRDSNHSEGTLRLNVKAVCKTFGITRVEVNDDIMGHHLYDYRDVLDVVLSRGDGTPTYILANTVDDTLNNVNYITRGADLYPQTATQVVLRMAIQHVMQLPQQPARYAHLPLITDIKKSKLSKRDPNTKGLMDYKELGYMPDAVMQFALQLGNKSIPLDIPMSFDEMVKAFDITKSRASNTAYQDHTLLFVNRLHIRATDSNTLSAMLQELYGTTADAKLIDLFKFRVSTLKQLHEHLQAVLRAVTDYPEEVQKLRQENFSATVCQSFRRTILHDLETAPLDEVYELLAC